MDHNHFYIARSPRACSDLHVITDAEWEFDFSTESSHLRILDTAPATCSAAIEYWKEQATERAGKCAHEGEICF